MEAMGAEVGQSNSQAKSNQKGFRESMVPGNVYVMCEAQANRQPVVSRGGQIRMDHI